MGPSSGHQRIQTRHGLAAVCVAAGGGQQARAFEAAIRIGRGGEHRVVVGHGPRHISARAACPGAHQRGLDVTRMSCEKCLDVGFRLGGPANLHQQARPRQPRGVERGVEGERAVVVGARLSRRVVRAVQLAALEIERRVIRGGGDGAGERDDLRVEIAVGRGRCGPQQQRQQAHRGGKQAHIGRDCSVSTGR